MKRYHAEGAPFEVEATIECHECGAVLEAFSDAKTGEWTVARLSDFTRERFGKPLCRSRGLTTEWKSRCSRRMRT